ncbi:MAG: hypothetical protein Q9208_000983 [Pyrenodesmia sp. 3 TL-2023]
MADALCGPSNSLQSFQKHASVDRTLQQDRLRSRQSPIEGFRTPNPNAGILDAEYNAFLAGESAIEPFDPQQAWQHEPPPHLQTHLPQQQAPDWALDFQHLHVDDTRSAPIPTAHFHQQAPMQRSSPGQWQSMPKQNSKPQGFQPQSSRRAPANMSYMMNGRQFGPYNQQYSTPPMAQHTESQVEESFDEEAFAKAFDQAAHDQLSESQGSTHQEPNLDQDLSPQASSAPEERMDYRIGSDRILDDSLQRQDDRSDARDADDLAKTAGLLLENVKHDQSSKFQESNFLSLMRQLRDKEVKVKGDAIVNRSRFTLVATAIPAVQSTSQELKK